ncbi:MAG: M23 family metallopeptidase [Rubricoccaceae bacterium]
MIGFLRDLLSRPGATRTVILLDPDAMRAPRQYEVRPGSMAYLAIVVSVGLAAVLVAAAVLTPLRRFVVGPGVEELRAVAHENALRAEALEDSMAVQYQQIAQLRALITGDVDALGEAALDPAALTLPEPSGMREPGQASGGAASGGAAEGLSEGAALPATGGRSPATQRAAAAYLAGLRLPALAPVDGVRSRGFSAADRHFGVDFAARTGTPVRAIGEGFVVFADWTHAGGYTLAVQHADGYLSVYRHNQQLLKRTGDRVANRETLALSGDTGEISSGPHLHFELWRNGLAQDPEAYLIVR